jgi:hypothetical protein
MIRVFISYRRDDCAGHAGRLYDHLVDRFGDDAVFMDVDAIEPGVDFGERIQNAIGSCSVLIALIGDQWLDIKDSGGHRRLDNPADLVRLEIAGALRRTDLPVIPVLVEGATMPPAERLPDDVQPLARRNALELSDGRWRYDADRLIEVLERVAIPGPRPSNFGVPRGGAAGNGSPAAGGRGVLRVFPGPLALGGVIAVVVATVAVVLLTGGDGDGGGRGDDARSAPTTPPTPPRPIWKADTPIETVTRPLSLTFRGDDLAVLSGDGFLRVVNTNNATGEEWQIKVDDGAIDVAAGFGSLWVVKHSTRSLLQINPRTQRREPYRYMPRTQGRPNAVATGEGAVWVATNDGTGPDACKDEGSGPGHVIKVTPQGMVIHEMDVKGRICDIAVGYGAVWVSTSSPDAVVRIPVQGGRPQAIPIGGRPSALAIGEGAVWVANDRRSITRIGRRTWRRDPRTIRLTSEPERLAVGAGSVWATSGGADRLMRIDPHRLKEPERIGTGPEPYAVGVHRGREVWLTLRGDPPAIQRVRLTR